jgi:prepilin-type N-terminal cleavage/methylation domain-containing protein
MRTNPSNENRQGGMTLLEILVAMVVAGLGVAAFLQTIKPTITLNKSNRGYLNLSGALSEVLDSCMTQPVSVLDGMNNMVFNSRQGVAVKLAVSTYTQGEADAILANLDVSRMRRLRVVAVIDTTRSLTATVSNYQENSTGKCFTR